MAWEKRTAPCVGGRAIATPRGIRLYVVFTDLDATRRALAYASTLARDLGGRIVLVVAQVVPYMLPLESPPVGPGFLERTLSELACENEMIACVYRCRDRERAIRLAVPPNSVVLLGVAGRRWWPDRDGKLVRLLQRDGHEVITVRPGDSPTADVDSRKAASIL